MPACRLTSAPTPAVTAMRRSSSRGTARPRSTINRRPSDADRERRGRGTRASARDARSASARPRRRRSSRPARGRRHRTSRRRRRHASRRRSHASARCTAPRGSAPQRRDDRSAVGVRRLAQGRRRGGRGRGPSRAAVGRAGRNAGESWSVRARAPCRSAASSSGASRAPTPSPARAARRTRRRRAVLTGAATPRAARDARRRVRRRGRRGASPRRRPPSRAKPQRNADERGRQTSASGKIAATTNVQPSRWCRNADRAKNHGFCSCTRNAVPAVTNASGQVEPPQRRGQPSAHERELRAAGEHQHLRPGAVRVHVDRGVREERHHRPEQDAERECERRPEVRPPASHPPDLLSHERLAEEAQTDEQDHGAERPVDHLSAWLHPPARDRRAPAVRRTP